ncbi:HPP family protein [Allokutzneria sp. NRRL B-24872]|uniref:CBS domain-containing protein n=1 Tax=Allokutzneria sp. NRRL B-24872 TaxID=1137961 RepID=UPI001177FA0B|nr:CBS domain-containing protein [Allokutzneria sp. NRRL B-24872]
MPVDTLMSSPAITVRPETPVLAAAALMTAHGYTLLPVTDHSGQLLGVVDELALLKGCGAGAVGAVMTSPARGIDVGAGSEELAEVLLGDGIRAVPVTDGSTVVGVITRRDLLRSLVRSALG